MTLPVAARPAAPAASVAAATPTVAVAVAPAVTAATASAAAAVAGPLAPPPAIPAPVVAATRASLPGLPGRDAEGHAEDGAGLQLGHHVGLAADQVAEEGGRLPDLVGDARAPEPATQGRLRWSAASMARSFVAAFLRRVQPLDGGQPVEREDESPLGRSMVLS